MASKKTLFLEIVTPERKVFSGDVDFGAFPCTEGEVGVLPDHAPLLSALAPGEIRAMKDGKTTHFASSGGFLEIRDNRISVAVQDARSAQEIDLEAIRVQKEELVQLLKSAKDASALSTAQKQLKQILLLERVGATVPKGSGASGKL